MRFAGQGVDADTFVLTLPMAAAGMAGTAGFVGGLSAATGMVIVETIALSTMVCNDLVMPLLLRARALALHAERDLSGLLLRIRRGAIVVILLLGYLYFRLAGDAYAWSASASFPSAVAQFAPAMIGGMYWRGGTRDGAPSAGCRRLRVWAYTLLLPSFSKSGWMPGLRFRRPVRHRIAEAAPAVRPDRAGRHFPLPVLEPRCERWRLRRGIADACADGSGSQPGDAVRRCAENDAPRRSALWRGSADAAELVPWSVASSGASATAFAAYARRPMWDRRSRQSGSRCRPRPFCRVPAGRRDRQRLGAVMVASVARRSRFRWAR